MIIKFDPRTLNHIENKNFIYYSLTLQKTDSLEKIENIHIPSNVEPVQKLSKSSPLHSPPKITRPR